MTLFNVLFFLSLVTPTIIIANRIRKSIMNFIFKSTGLDRKVNDFVLNMIAEREMMAAASKKTSVYTITTL